MRTLHRVQLCATISPDLIDIILRERQRADRDSVLIKIRIGGFLKLCMSIFYINDAFPHIKSGISNEFKESGVKKIVLIAVVPDVPVNYVNVKKLWINLGFQNLDRKFTIARDLMPCNLLLGMMSHSSSHPCCWCDIDNGNLHKKGNQKTISNLMNLFWDYFDAKADRKDAKNFGNVIHPPIICDDIENSHTCSWTFSATRTLPSHWASHYNVRWLGKCVAWLWRMDVSM